MLYFSHKTYFRIRYILQTKGDRVFLYSLKNLLISLKCLIVLSFPPDPSNNTILDDEPATPHPLNEQSDKKSMGDLCSLSGFLSFISGILKDGSFVRPAKYNFIASLNFYGDHFCLLCFPTSRETALFQVFLPFRKGACPVENYYMERFCFECFF